MSSNSYRIRTTVGGGENVINVNLKQKVKTLNILSLEIEPEDEYDIHTSDYGVIVGRVLANNAFGVPNVKVSVFIPISSDDESDYVISNEYPYKTPQSKDINGVKYNLVLKKKDGPGTFVDKNTMLDNEGYREVYDKYWTYTTTTNQSGDYMIFGVPTGSTQIHYDCDLSDIGMLSQHPYDLVAKGYDANLFDSMNEFTAKDLNSAVHIISQDKTVYVYPFWGDKNANKIGITRADIDVNYKFEPSCVFMGSSITDPQGSYIGVDGQPNGSNGRFNSLATSVGDIEIIRKTQDGHVEELKENVVGIIDGNGVWCYQIPMNLDRIGTDEFGNMTVVNDPERGIPTRARVRFRISLTDAKNESMSEYTAKFLIPCNPPLRPKNGETYSRSAQINYDAFSKEDWDNIYEFGDKTPDSCFRDLYWGKVYSVKQYYLRYQYEYEPKIVGYGDKMSYDTNEDFWKPGTPSSFKDFPYVGKNAGNKDRAKEEERLYDYSNFPTRNAFKMSCISSIDNVNGLNPFPYNTMYAGAEEHINDGTIFWFRYHFTSESSDSSYPNKGLHFCFENDWVNGCLYFPRMIIKRNAETEYDYFGRKTDDGGNQVSENNSYPYVWISGRHDYRLADDRDEFVLPENLQDIFMSRWTCRPNSDDDDRSLVNWSYTHVYEALFYAFSRCRMMGGGLTKKTTMIGQNVFYYRCGVPTHKKQYETVDLDLPSKTLWAKCNLGAEKETDFGLYYQWGDYIGYTGANEQEFNTWNYVWYYDGAEYLWETWTKYNDTDKKVTLDNEDDAVYAATEGAMRMPTKEQLEELWWETDHDWTTINGVKGMKLSSKIDPSKYIFIPAAGYFEGTSLESKGEICDLWSNSCEGIQQSSLERKDGRPQMQAYRMKFSENENGLKTSARCLGITLRGVCQPSIKKDDEDFRRMYATDVILLGNLEDIYDSLPKLYEALPSTTTTFPPMSPPESLTEAGMTWAGYPGQYEKYFTKKEVWDDRVDIFGNDDSSLVEQAEQSDFKLDVGDFLGYDSEYALAFLDEGIKASRTAYALEHAYDKYVTPYDNQWLYHSTDFSSKERIALDILLGMLNRRYSLFFGVMNSGGVSAFLSYVPAAFVNLSRICELDVHNDTAFKTKLLNGDFKLEDVIIPINGLIDSFDITTNDNRSQFASMNYDINKRDKVDFVYKQCVTTPMSMSSFDGRLQSLIDNTKTYGLTYPTDQADESYMEFRFRNPYIPEGQKCIMHNFRAYFNSGDFVNLPKAVSGSNSKARFLHNVNYCNDHLILTENSFYFYFGLRTGFSAIDMLRNKFIGKLKEETITTNPLLVNKLGQTCEGTTAMIESTLTWRNMTPPISVYIYQGSTLEFSNTYNEGSSVTLTLKAGIHKAVVTDSSGREYQRVFSLSPKKITMDAVGYYNELTNVPELEILLIDGQSVAISSQSGNVLTLSATTNTYDVTCNPSFSAVTPDNLIQFSNETTSVNVTATDTEAPCVTGESNVIFKTHIKPKLLLNGVPVEQLKYWKSYTADVDINTYKDLLNNTPDSVFKSGRFFVWDSIKTAHPDQSSRNYDFGGVTSEDKLAYISSMCSSVFGQDGMELRDINKAPTYTSQGMYLVYQNFNYGEPNNYWGREVPPGFNLHRVQLNQIEPNVANFRNAPHIVGTNYPRYSDTFSKKTFLKKSALCNDGMLGDSGYTNNQVYISHEYGARANDVDMYYGDDVFGIYLFGLHHIGLRNRSIKELDKPGILSTTPEISGTTDSSYYLVDTVIEDVDEETDTTIVHNYSGVTNYYGVRTVDKRMDYQFALKTPLLLPSGVESFPNLEQKNLMGGEMVVHLYGGFRLNYEPDKTLTSYSNGQNGPNFDADLYSVEIYEDNSTTEQLTYNMEKKRVWGYSGNTQTDFIGDDIDYVVYTIGDNGNGISGNTNIDLNFTDCSTSFDEKVYPGSSEGLSLSYASPISIIPPSSGECHISYDISVGESGCTGSLSSENFKFTILGDSLWGGETYTHSNVTGQTQYGSGCDDAIYAATDGELRMPTKSQLQELLSGTTHTWKTIEGVDGMKFWSGGTEPMDSDKYIFIPAAGYCWFGTHRYQGSAAYIWSNARCEDEDNAAWVLWCQEPIVNPENRCAGHNLRGVAPSGYTGSDVVDLGLSVKWAKCNLGADTETDSGLFYQWADTQGYSNTTLAHSFDWNHYKWGTENNIIKYNNEDIFNLKTDDDAAYATNSNLKMPTKEQLQELLSGTTYTKATIEGVDGMKFINKSDSTKYIFIPFGGFFDGEDNQYKTYEGLVWSQSRVNNSEDEAWLLECYGNFEASVAQLNNVERCCGLNVRPIASSEYTGDDVVDLGLSSGTLWAKCNLGAETETDSGLFYQWGDTEGHSEDSSYNFTNDTYKWYDSTSGTLTKYNDEDISILDHSDDAAYVSTNMTTSIPTKEQINELLTNTEHIQTAINGVNGMKFINKSDSTKYIFIPFGGYHSNDIHEGSNECGYIWSGSRGLNDMDKAYSLNFNGENNIILDVFNRCLGYNIRNVALSGYTGNDVVDLNLPSGTKWAKRNLGAETCTDFGLFYQWGDIQGYDGEKHLFNCDDYKWHDSEKEYTVKDDAVYMATGGEMCTPTYNELQELLSGTTHIWTSISGVTGMKFWEKDTEEPTDGDSYIFIPAAGYWWNGEKFEDNLSGYIWSNTKDNSDYTAYCLNAIPTTTVGSDLRVGGYNLRGVAPSGYTGDDVVDLGLSSGTLWAKCNLGASTETDSGLFYQWGDAQGYSGVTVHAFDFRDYIWGSGQYSSDVTKYNADDGKIVLDTKICKHWVQTYSDSIPYSTPNRPDMSVCVCHPSGRTEYLVSQVLSVDAKYLNTSRTHHNDGAFIVPYEHFNATDTPITNKKAKDEYYYQLNSDIEPSLSGNTFITIPTKTIYSSMNASSLNLSTLLKQGVTYNVGYTYFAGSISCINGSSTLEAKVRLNTPLRNNDGSINYNSNTLNGELSWHTIGDITNYWVENSQIGSVTYDPLKIEFTYRRKTTSSEHIFFFRIENGLTYKVKITFL